MKILINFTFALLYLVPIILVLCTVDIHKGCTAFICDYEPVPVSNLTLILVNGIFICERKFEILPPNQTVCFTPTGGNNLQECPDRSTCYNESRDIFITVFLVLYLMIFLVVYGLFVYWINYDYTIRCNSYQPIEEQESRSEGRLECRLEDRLMDRRDLFLNF